MRASWFIVESLTATISRAKVGASITRAIARIRRSDVIVVDDIGMLPAGQDAAEAFYRVVDAGYKRRSIAVTSNLQLSRSDTITPKPLAIATVDRLLHHAIWSSPKAARRRLAGAVAGQGVKPWSDTPPGDQLTAHREFQGQKAGRTDVRLTGDLSMG